MSQHKNQPMDHASWSWIGKTPEGEFVVIVLDETGTARRMDNGAVVSHAMQYIFSADGTFVPATDNRFLDDDRLAGHAG